MKFSFESGEYRKNLAEELRFMRHEGKSEDAKKKLAEEKYGLQYTVAEAVKRTGGIDTGHVSDSRGQEDLLDKPIEISVETRVFKDADGVERPLKIQIFNISRSVPEKIQLQFDVLRIGTNPQIDRALVEERINNLLPQEKALFEKVWGAIYASLSDEERRWADEKRIKSISTFGDKARQYLTDEDVDFFYKANVEVTSQLPEQEQVKFKIIKAKIFEVGQDEMLYNEYSTFLNKITEGDFSRKDMLSHAVSGFRDSQDESEADGIQKRMQKVNKNTQEVVFDIHQASSTSLWFHSGGASYATGGGRELGGMTNIVLICDGESERLRNEIKAVNFRGVGALPEESERAFNQKISLIMSEKKEDIASPATVLQAFYQTIGRVGVGGELFFKQEEPWLYISKWIVDAYHGRLYKITEDNTQKEAHQIENN